MAHQNFGDMIKQTKAQIAEVPVEDVESKVGDPQVTFIDVREADEWDGGIIPGALTVARGFLELQIEEKIPDKNKEIIVYCAGGVRSALAAKALQELGYKNVKSLIGGFVAWKRAGVGGVEGGRGERLRPLRRRRALLPAGPQGPRGHAGRRARARRCLVQAGRRRAPLAGTG